MGHSLESIEKKTTDFISDLLNKDKISKLSIKETAREIQRLNTSISKIFPKEKIEAYKKETIEKYPQYKHLSNKIYEFLLAMESNSSILDKNKNAQLHLLRRHQEELIKENIAKAKKRVPDLDTELIKFIENKRVEWKDNSKMELYPKNNQGIVAIHSKEGKVYVWMLPDRVLDYESGKFIEREDKQQLFNGMITWNDQYIMDEIKPMQEDATPMGIKNPKNFCYLISTCQRLARTSHRDRQLLDAAKSAENLDLRNVARLFLGAVNKLREGKTLDDLYLEELANGLVALNNVFTDPTRKQDATELLGELDSKLKTSPPPVIVNTVFRYSPIRSEGIDKCFKNIAEHSDLLYAKPLPPFYDPSYQRDESKLTVPFYTEMELQTALENQFSFDKRSGVVCLVLSDGKIIDRIAADDWKKNQYGSKNLEKLQKKWPGNNISFRLAQRIGQEDLPLSLPKSIEVNVNPLGTDPNTYISKPSVSLKIPLAKDGERTTKEYELTDVIRRSSVGYLSWFTKELGRHYVYYKKIGENKWLEFDDNKVTPMTEEQMLKTVGTFGYSYLYEEKNNPSS